MEQYVLIENVIIYYVNTIIVRKEEILFLVSNAIVRTINNMTTFKIIKYIILNWKITQSIILQSK